MSASIKRVLDYRRLFNSGEYLGEMFGCDASIFRDSWDNNELLLPVWDWKETQKLESPPLDSIYRFFSIPGSIWVGGIVSMADEDRFADIEHYKDKVKLLVGKSVLRSRPVFNYPYICLSDSQIDAVNRRLLKITNKIVQLF